MITTVRILRHAFVVASTVLTAAQALEWADKIRKQQHPRRIRDAEAVVQIPPGVIVTQENPS